MRFSLLTLILFVITAVFGQATLPIKDTFLTRNSLPTGYSHNGLGTDFSGPKLRFDSVNDSLVIHVDTIPGYLSFLLGTNDTFTGTVSNATEFEVSQSDDGTTYSTLFTAGNGTSFDRDSVVIYNFINITTRYFKFKLTNKVTGTDVALYKIHIDTLGGLPVRLIQFNGNVVNDGVSLTWTTASELDNSHFEIYNSLDGQNFFKIGRREGAGNSNSIKHYSFIDPKVEVLQYYRLKQVDFDNGSEYSPIVSVRAENNKLDFVKETAEDLIIAANKYTRVLITNQTGQVLMNEEIVAKTTINKSMFNSGVFIIQVASQEGIQTLKWVNTP